MGDKSRGLPFSSDHWFRHTLIRMGDKSPKANQKQNAQKQAKNNTFNQKKNAASAAKQIDKAKK